MSRSTTTGVRWAGAVMLALAPAVVLAAQQRPWVTMHDDDITIRGCVQPAGAAAAHPSGAPLFWSRSDIMLAAASQGDTLGIDPSLAQRVFYWLDEDEDLAKHVGQLVEVKGELQDFKKGDVEIDHDGDYTKIEMHLDGKKEEAKVPNAWLGPSAGDKDQKLDIVARRVDVKDIDVVGACHG
jgi:hypothetical protein